MSIADLIDQVQFVTDAEGNRQAVQVNIENWEEIVNVLKELETEIYWDSLLAKSPETLERLAEEARAERRAGRTEGFDPDSL